MSLRSRLISLGWIALGAFGLVVIVVLGVGLRSERDAERWVAHTLEVEGVLRTLEADVNGMAGELRGYVVSREQNWLQTYRDHVDEAWRETNQVAELTADNPVERGHVRSLRQELQAQVDLGDQLIASVRRGAFAESERLVASGQGESAQGRLRATIQRMWTEEERLLGLREARASRLRRIGVALAVLAGALMLVQFLVTFGFVRSRFRALEREQDLLRQAGEYAQSIVETVREPLIVADADLRVVSANRSFFLLFGLANAETVGVPLAELGGGAWNITELLAQLHRVFADGQELTQFAFEHDFPRLGRRHLLLSARKVYRPGNHTGLILIAIEDDTERARNEEKLRRINSDLEGFAYTVAHDLRAPLRGLQGFAEALLEDYRDSLDETGRGYARHIAGAARRMDGLISDLLDYSRLSRTELELAAVPLGQVVAAAREQVGAALKAKGAEVRVEEPLPSVRAHFVVLVQVVANLLDNGAKFVAPGASPQLTVRAERRQERVRLWVEDNGIGIAPQYHERIFRVFERLHGQDAYPGTGIGLAIVRKGAERMGGTAGVDSAPGQGARFWIDLQADSA
ncbi:MAG TPA: ATP-binding protein [Opitutaceae bacterium]|jgi:PAS domain S-box-containing protein|nr:ATP-binding protein [Opitutaceae bacterium]